MRRTLDWLRQAKKDLQHAFRSLEFGDYEWSCFSAQQAAEKGVKALYQALGADAIGHSVSMLLKRLPRDLQPDEELINQAKVLDRHYILQDIQIFIPKVLHLTIIVGKTRKRRVKLRRKLYNIVRIRYAPSKEKVKKIISKYAKKLAGKIDLKLVLLFGSYAKNTYSYESDIDLLIVAEDLPENPMERIDKLIDESMPLEIQPFAYTPKEFRMMLAENHPIVKEALLHGEILYVSKNYEKVLMEVRGLPQF